MLPLSPVPVPRPGALVLEAALRLAHRALVLLHLDPGAASRIEGAPHRQHHTEEQHPVADHHPCEHVNIEN